MKNVIDTIDLRDNTSLLGLACAMKEFTIMRKCGVADGAEEPKPIKFALDAIMELLHYKLQQIFVEDYSQYAENKFAIGEDSDGIKIKVFDEKYDNPPEKCEESDNDNSAGDLDDILSSIDGLESADDYVDRIADLKNDLRNKRGGQA
tara:strand:+ start:470 stop:913 length:444 start_codon:yes stop_codon:yes gene_type:complete